MYKNPQIQEEEERLWKALAKTRDNDQIDIQQITLEELEEEDDNIDALDDAIIMYECGLIADPYGQEVWEGLKERINFYERHPEYSRPKMIKKAIKGKRRKIH